MGPATARLIRRYALSQAPVEHRHSLYRWLKRYWRELNRRDRHRFKVHMEMDRKLEVPIRVRSADRVFTLDWSSESSRKI